MREWFRGMVDAFMDEYVSYLKTLGMQVVLSGCSRIIAKAIADVDQQPSVIPTFSISPDLSIDAPVLYMQKTFGNRVTLMIEIKVQDMFASVNLYTVDYYSLAGADLPKLSNRENSSGPLTRFTEEASAFKNLIHLNSFIYDFHLRFLIDTISDARKVVHWLDFVDVFKAFMRYNSTPANYSRNSIEYGVYRDRCDMSNEELFKVRGHMSYSIDRLKTS
jgi:hypothetical protein